MAYSFDGTDDVISATITAVDTGSWTLCAWIYPETQGESNSGRIVAVQTSGGSERQHLQVEDSLGLGELRGFQRYSPTDAAATSVAGAITLSEWQFVASVFNSSTVRITLFRGTLTSAVAALSLADDAAGTSSRGTGGTGLRIGNNAAGDRAFDGELGRVWFIKRALSTAELERIRLGDESFAPDTTNVAGYYRLDADAKDRSGNGADGTVSGAVLTDGFYPALPSAPVDATSLTATATDATSLTATATDATSLTLTAV